VVTEVLVALVVGPAAVTVPALRCRWSAVESPPAVLKVWASVR
jgi:hypothetical protein